MGKNQVSTIVLEDYVEVKEQNIEISKEIYCYGRRSSSQDYCGGE